MQRVKDQLVKWGADNFVTQTALRVALGLRGYRIAFRSDAIALRSSE